MAGPLAGIRILDLSAVLMGPSATQLLGDMGADVIKIEPPDGDTTRRIGPGRSPTMGSNFLNMNRSKRSVVLDLKNPASRDVMHRLIERADVLVLNIRPQAARRIGLDHDSVRAVNPRIVYCALTGFGSDGPYAGQPAYDDLIQGLAALPALYAQSAGEPHYVPTPIADRVAGLHAVVAILGALMHRERSGEGQAVEVPMFETVAHTVLADQIYGHTFVPPIGEPGYPRVLSPQRHPYRTSDGWLCILVYNDKHWRDFFNLIGRGDLLADPRFGSMRGRNEHIDELYGMLARALAGKTTAQWLELLAKADIPAGPMNTLHNLIDDPHLARKDFFQQVEHPTEGSIRSMRVPTRWSATPPEPARLAPNLGEHGDEVLRELGYSGEEIVSLRERGVLGAAH
ncbi:CaiB/BaiF CoA transferase family protein [Ramlibacter sp.]|uniref:CaiB/BaiF CoA transferase family protein n=1 Tax=Ramlibacter sp. TaxID=1917967 RepID=UPI003D111953